MNYLLLFFYRYFTKNKLLFYSLLAVLCFVLSLGIRRIHLTQDLNKSITGNAHLSNYFKLLDKRAVNEDISFIIRREKSITFDSLQLIASDFSAKLKKQFPTVFEHIQHEAPDPNELYSYLLEHAFAYVDTTSIATKLHDKAYIQQTIQSNHDRLFTPEGIVLKKFLFNDPFHWIPEILLRWKKQFTSASLTTVQGSYALTKDSSVVLLGKFSTHFLSQANNEKELKAIERWANTYFSTKQLRWNYFTPKRIALSNSEQVKSDTLLTLCVSISCILLLLLLFYRRFTLPFFFLVPGLFGALVGLGVIGYIHPEIMGLAIGTGAMVIGIVIDYSFHFFTHLKHSSSIEDTLKAIAKPLSTACLTTILAFGALYFTHSRILQDFGLFAALSLIGTLIGVLFVLPVVLPNYIVQSTQKITQSAQVETKKQTPLLRKIIGFATLGITVCALFYAPKVRFENDLDKLNFYPNAIKQAEQDITGFVPGKDKRIFVAVSNSNDSIAQTKNQELNRTLVQLSSKQQVKNFLNTSSLVFTEKQLNEKRDAWHTFWRFKKDTLFAQLDKLSLQLGYTPIAFDDFKQVILADEKSTLAPVAMIEDLRSKLEEHTASQHTYLSILTVPLSAVPIVKAELSKQSDFIVLDRADLATTIVTTVSEDFSYILWVSSLLVFGVMLLHFGRIELTLITFLPMAISWVWILGFAAFFDIPFNLINVVITTFIFGIGDDFALFVTEGKLEQYKTGVDHSKSFRTGTILSAVTTIIGTGVLVLAKHPAIHSIGLISIIGLSSILLISLFVQPLLFDFLITRRVEKKKIPWTLSGLLISAFAFAFFLSGCLIISITQLGLRILPTGKKRHKYILHRVLRKFCWAQLYVMLNVRKKVLGREQLNFDQPSILIANHQSFIDILALIMLNERVVLLTNSWVYNSFFFGRALRFLDYLHNEDNIEDLVKAAQEKVAQGYTIAIFPEGTRSKTEDVGRFHKGAFVLAEQLNLDITPVVLHGFNQTMQKGDFYLKNGCLTIEVLPRIKASDTSFGVGYYERNKNISKYFKQCYKTIQVREKDSAYIWPLLLSNYLYKTPIIEWYLRIKFRFERTNYEHYNLLIGERQHILDLGCGYGFLSFYLKLANDNRSITGVDYDEHKIEIAQNSYLRDASMNFYAADISTLNIPPSDAIFLMDVLHYLTPEKQKQVLLSCVTALEKDGLLIIRDGVASNTEQHEKTKRTEKFSTQVFKFNKVANELHFFDEHFLRDFAKEHQLHCEAIPQANTLSNQLFVLRK